MAAWKIDHYSPIFTQQTLLLIGISYVSIAVFSDVHQLKLAMVHSKYSLVDRIPCQRAPDKYFFVEVVKK